MYIGVWTYIMYTIPHSALPFHPNHDTPANVSSVQVLFGHELWRFHLPVALPSPDKTVSTTPLHTISSNYWPNEVYAHTVYVRSLRQPGRAVGGCHHAVPSPLRTPLPNTVSGQLALRGSLDHLPRVTMYLLSAEGGMRLKVSRFATQLRSTCLSWEVDFPHVLILSQRHSIPRVQLRWCVHVICGYSWSAEGHQVLQCVDLYIHCVSLLRYRGLVSFKANLRLCLEPTNLNLHIHCTHHLCCMDFF